MANPKHKHSSARGAKRRTHYKAVAPALGTCSNCGSAIRMHTVCNECGHYRGKLAIEKSVTA